MAEAAEYVDAHPGCCILDVARAIMPHVIGKNNAFGYAPVHRAIKAGLIHAVMRGNRYVLTSL